jgi:quercetin dioxygenase-like cupin family protein
MEIIHLDREERFNAARHVLKVVQDFPEGDISLVCWEPNQLSPYHCHPDAVEIYLCLSGGGTWRTPAGKATVQPGSLACYERAELHEFTNGCERTVLLRVRFGINRAARFLEWRGQPEWTQTKEDAAYFAGPGVDSQANV